MSTANTERWQQVKELLNDALELDLSERADFLRSTCDDMALIREVEELLDLDSEASSFIDEPLICLEDESCGAAWQGRVIGARYQLEKEIGFGGMGRVFLASRADEEFHRQVAVKFLDWGSTSAELLQRFRRERQILADLDHPFIARLLDGGTTEDKRPYLVMEYVDGLPIHVFCKEKDLDLDERLDLFEKVCEAVHFAHQNLVVHQDLKPGNILVTAESNPKLLDFGIAKLLGEESRRAKETPERWQFYTLGFASPEQVMDKTITTASDVFSLGALLYFLLCDRKAFPIGEQSRLDVERAVVSLTPPLPSEVPPGEASRFGRELTGDLEQIVMKALEKEPRDRYGSVQQLVEDLSRYRDGLPVSAVKPTFAYRVTKFVTRHKIAVGSALALVLVLMGFGVSMTLLWRNAVAEKLRADRASQVSKQVRTLLEETFKVADPNRSGGAALIPVRDILDEGRKVVEESPGEDPEVRSALLVTLARVYRNLGLYEDARPLAEEALQIRLREFGEDHLQTAESLHALASIWWHLGRPEKSEPLLSQALDIQRRRQDSEHPDYLHGLSNLATLLAERGDYAAAQGLHEEILALKRRVHGNMHEEVATSLHNLAYVHLQLGESPEAERLYRRALEIRSRSSDLLAEQAVTLNSLGAALEDQGLLEEALASYEKALKIRRQLYPEGHGSLSGSLNNLARSLHSRGDLGRPEQLFLEALEIPEEVLPTQHPLRAKILRNLAEYYQDARRPQLCADRAREAIKILESQNLAARALDLADVRGVLGGCLGRLGRYEEAEALLVESCPTLALMKGRNLQKRQRAWNRILDFYESWGRPEQAVIACPSLHSAATAAEADDNTLP